MPNPADEIVVIVDEQNNVVDAVPRREMRAKRLPHRSTYILVFNAQGDLYVHKRTMTKDVYPGYYDLAAGGVVLAGESYETSAGRELAEELGIRNVPLTWLFTFYYSDLHTRVWGGVFSCVYNGAIVLQEEEIESGAFMSLSNVTRRIQLDRWGKDNYYLCNSSTRPSTDMVIITNPCHVFFSLFMLSSE